MSSFAVKVERIDSVEPHPNADRLDLIHILGWQCVSAKGIFQTGDLCVYLPIDSILPDDVEKAIFGPDAKVKLHNSRVRTIKLRGAISQGLAVKPEEVGQYKVKLGQDLTAALGVKKYEPPAAPVHMSGQQVSWRKKNPDFKEYTDLENAKYYTDLFSEYETVVVTEKIHGTNFRAGWVPFFANTPWKKLQKFLRVAPQFEFVYGSRRVQLQDKNKGSGWYERGSNTPNGAPIGNVYAEAVRNYRLREAIPKGKVIYGEIYGDGIQKGYTYGCSSGERKLVVFDVMNSNYGEYYDAHEFPFVTDLPKVPELYYGTFDYEKIKALTLGPSALSASQKIREGVVCKSEMERTSRIGRAALKFISDDYLLLKDNTDFH